MQCWEAMPNLHYVTVGSYVMDGHGAKPPSASPARGDGSGGKRASRSSCTRQHPGGLAGSFTDVIRVPHPDPRTWTSSNLNGNSRSWALSGRAQLHRPQ